MKSRLLSSLLMIGILVGAVVGGSRAFFSDTETSQGNRLEAGSLDLLVNGQNDPIAIVNFSDLKPGDNYVQNKTLRLNDNPGKVWMHLKDLVATQGAQTEPEELEENGVPKFDIQNYITYDLTIGDEVVIATADGVLLPEAVSCWIPLGTIPGAIDVALLQSFHLPGSVTNWAQGDMLTFTEEFWTIQDRHNPDQLPPDTGSGRVWDPEENKCVDEVVDPGEPFVDEVTEVGGTFGHPGEPVSSDPAVAEPLVVGAPDDQFIQISDNSSVTMRFVDNKAVNGPGADIRIHVFDTEFLANGEILVSDGGVSFVSAGIFSDTVNAEIDLAGLGLSQATHVKIVDQVAGGDPFPTLGFDVDAVEAINSVMVP